MNAVHRRALEALARGGVLLLMAVAACDGGDAHPPDSSVAAPSATPPGDPATPVVLIVVDTLRADHLGCYGYPRDTSPHLDRLAADSILFRRAYSHAPWTTPSIGALMTSRYPSALGIRDVRSTLSPDLVLIAELVQQAGHVTGAAISHSFCSGQWGFDQGFDEFDESNIVGHDAVCGPGVTDRGLEFLDRHAGKPFLLWLHYFDPHFAYLGHDPFPFDDGPGYDGPVKSGTPFSELLRLRRHMSPADLAEIVRLYDSEVRITDEQIGRILDRLREDGLYERSLIIFTADHGEEFMDHADLGHTKTLYDEVLRVPLMVKLPFGTPAVVERPVGLVDVYPTVAEVLGLEVEHEIEGRSLLSKAGTEPDRPVFFETTRKNVLRGMVLGDVKLIYDVEREQYQMFDLGTDPDEKQDLYSSRQREARPLKARLQQWIESVQVLSAEQRTGLSEEEVERLRALGYVVPEEDG